jgi:putative DNA primase/helicase
MASPKEKPRSFPLTDSGNAELIASLFGDRLRFDHRRNRWLHCKKGNWAEDSNGEVYLMAKEGARARFASAARIGNDTERREGLSWALKSESKYRLNAALELAKCTAPIADSGDNWDSDPLLLGVANGVVNLQTGKLRPTRPEDRITFQTRVGYDPAAICPRFEEFLNQVFQKDDQMVRYVQKAIGYSLTAEVSEQCLFLCYGEGANGKSTFLETVRSLLGNYSHNLPFSAFELRARSSVPNDIAGIVGKRFVTAVETNENVAFNEGRIKALTGGDQTTARFLYQEHFSFDPTAKFWLAFNHQPRVTDDSHGFWRRVRLIPFLARFDGTIEDKQLGAKLRAEAAGILAWAVRGCLMWQSEGLGSPTAVREATMLYRKENDSLAMFIEDWYDVCPDAVVPAAQLRRDYTAWCIENGETALNARALGLRLRTLGAEATRIGVGRLRARGWRGLRRKAIIHPDIAEDSRTERDTAFQ